MKKFLLVFILMVLGLFKIDIVCAEKIYKEYKVGDMVTYNDMDFYVIEDSDESSDRVTMLKAEPLTVDEVNTYGGVGTDNNHVNMYVKPNTINSSYQKAYDLNGYGGMAYYSSETCGWLNDSFDETGCTTDYESSEVKYVVDAWANDKLNALDLTEDSLGYSARLITFDELFPGLGYDWSITSAGAGLNPSVNENVPSWIYNSNCDYWTMSQYGDSASSVWYVGGKVSLYYTGVNYNYGVVRPVITLKKQNYDNTDDKIENEPGYDKEDESSTDVEDENDQSDINKEEFNESIDNNNQIISVPDTILNKKNILVIIGITLITISVVLVIIIKKRKCCIKKINDR